MKITLAGTGVTPGDVSLRAIEAADGATVIVKTALSENGIALTKRFPDAITLDDVYRRSRNFDTLNKNLAAEVLKYARENPVVYYVDGNPADDVSCRMIMQKRKDTEVLPGVSKAAACLSASAENTRLSPLTIFRKIPTSPFPSSCSTSIPPISQGIQNLFYPIVSATKYHAISSLTANMRKACSTNATTETTSIIPAVS